MRRLAAAGVLLLAGCSSGDGSTTNADRAETSTSSALSSSTTAATTEVTEDMTPPARLQEYDVPAGSHPHDVAAAADCTVWYTAQPTDVPRVERLALPPDASSANLNTAVFDAADTLWFTGVYYASLAGSHVASVNPATGAATVIEPPTEGQRTRRLWSDSQGRIWCSQWNAGQVALLDPHSGRWREWRLPGDHPQAYAVYVDDRDRVWLSDFGANALVEFDPSTEEFTSHPLPSQPSEVRQIHGRPGEVWGAASAADKLVVLRTGG